MAIQNAQQLEAKILAALERVADDCEYVPQAQEVGNLAGKAINLARARMEHAKQKKDLGSSAPKILTLQDE